MVMLMLSTLIATLLTNISAKLAELPGGLAVKRHELSCKPAHICTLHIQFYARAHHIQVLFFKARSGTVIACSCAQITGFNTFFVFV